MVFNPKTVKYISGHLHSVLYINGKLMIPKATLKEVTIWMCKNNNFVFSSMKCYIDHYSIKQYSIEFEHKIRYILAHLHCHLSMFSSKMLSTGTRDYFKLDIIVKMNTSGFYWYYNTEYTFPELFEKVLWF